MHERLCVGLSQPTRVTVPQFVVLHVPSKGDLVFTFSSFLLSFLEQVLLTTFLCFYLVFPT